MTRRLYLQLYVALLVWTMVWFVAVHIAFRVWGGEGGPPAERLRVASAMLVDTLRDVPDPELPARLGTLADELSMDLVVWSSDGRVLAEATRRPMIRPRHPGPGWSQDRAGIELVVPLDDGRQAGLRSRLRPRPGRRLSFPATIALLSLVMAAGSFPVARHLAKRIERVAAGVARWGKGELTHRIPVEGRDEVATLATTFNRAAEQIDALVTQQRQMLTNASHELRSPLARLRMALELLAEEPAADQRARLIEEAQRDIVDLDALIEDLLLMARADMRTPRRPLESVDLRALVASEAGRVGGEVEISGAAPPLDGDPLLLRHLVRNLLENAHRHGQGKDVKAILASTNESVILAVEDRGPGIPESERERIFAPFYRLGTHANAAGGSTGFGVGLAMVRQVARYHGGEVQALAHPSGSGSRFEVVLPRDGIAQLAAAAV
ncbi:MAG TPA: HAMP domain-containing sensor histidine kinase [Polyangia bacterium]|nr:HAMP domain-containing sensor histidine kinase [Polyangia bacterium]